MEVDLELERKITTSYNEEMLNKYNSLLRKLNSEIYATIFENRCIELCAFSTETLENEYYYQVGKLAQLNHEKAQIFEELYVKPIKWVLDVRKTTSTTEHH